jgi:hypothetical protein
MKDTLAVSPKPLPEVPKPPLAEIAPIPAPVPKPIPPPVPEATLAPLIPSTLPAEPATEVYRWDFANYRFILSEDTLRIESEIRATYSEFSSQSAEATEVQETMTTLLPLQHITGIEWGHQATTKTNPYLLPLGIVALLIAFLLFGLGVSVKQLGIVAAAILAGLVGIIFIGLALNPEVSHRECVIIHTAGRSIPVQEARRLTEAAAAKRAEFCEEVLRRINLNASTFSKAD